MQGECNEIETTVNGCNSEEELEIIRENRIVDEEFKIKLLTEKWANGMGRITEVEEDDGKPEKEERCVKRKRKLAKNASVRHKKFWMFDENEKKRTDKNGNTIFVWGDKDVNCGVSINRDEVYKDEGFLIRNGRKDTDNGKPSITKRQANGKNYTLICK